MPGRSATWHVVLAAIVSAGCTHETEADDTVALRPGQDLQTIVAAAAEGTRFLLEPGVYRQQTIFPNDRQQFIGQDGVVLSGAIELAGWTEKNGVWSIGGLPAPLYHHGECQAGRDLCTLREDLFVNDVPYARVGSLDELASATWYYQDGRAHLRDDPTGQSIELGVTPLAFGGSGKGVVLEDLIVEKYASDAQKGAIDSSEGRGWTISRVTARWNHGVGLDIGSRTRVTGGSFSHNGQLGISASGEGATIEGAEIAFNNYAGYDRDWEAGGTKFARARNLVVRNSCVHHNLGPGLWTDIDNIDVLYEGNKVFSNTNDGIKHEISYDAVIRDNVVADNGIGFDTWLWGAQILVQNSSNVEIYDNMVQVSPTLGNGIAVINQERGAGPYGPRTTRNNDVYDNTIIHLGRHGRNGVVSDTEDPVFWRDGMNRFDYNNYYLVDPVYEYWNVNDETAAWERVQVLGYERHGALIVERRLPVELSCANPPGSPSPR